jgi:hypothetical protein
VYGGRYDAPVERLVRLFRVTSSTMSVVLLIGFNLLPLVGAVLWGWNAFSLLILYWAENGIVGAFAVARILRAEGPIEAPGVRLKLAGVSALSRLAIVPFFLMHYGIFWIVHGIFVFSLPLFMGIPGSVAEIGGFGSLPVIGPDGLPAIPSGPAAAGIRWDAIAVGAIGLTISHGASFWLNYLGRGEYRTTSGPAQAMAPYGRVIVLHLTIILGAIVSLSIGSPLGSVGVLVAIKTVIDLALHLASHRKAAARASLLAGT